MILTEQKSDHDLLIETHAAVTTIVKSLEGRVPDQCIKDNLRICHVETSLEKWSRFGWAIGLALALTGINGFISLGSRVLAALTVVPHVVK